MILKSWFTTVDIRRACKNAKNVAKHDQTNIEIKLIVYVKACHGHDTSKSNSKGLSPGLHQDYLRIG